MTQEKFSYSTQPHVAPVKAGSQRSKYRDDDNAENANSRVKNLMYDARVIRGSTYASKALSNEKENEPGWKRGSAMRRDGGAGAGGKRKFVGKRGSSPPPVDGRVHMDMQTDEFLEELTDRPIQVDIDTQTLPFADRPPSPLFVRAKTGQDADTQILSGDLFDFDLEVEPILEVLVGKTLHVAMLETLQEEELEALRIQQEEYEAIRNLEISEVQRLEAEYRRNNEEKARRVAQERKRVEEQRCLEEKIAARCFSHQYLGQLHAQVFALLEEEGAFYDPVQREVEEIFMKDVILSLTQDTAALEVATAMADEILENVRYRSKQFEAEAIRLRNEYLEQLAREAELAAEAERIRLEQVRLAALELERQQNEDENGSVSNNQNEED